MTASPLVETKLYIPRLRRSVVARPRLSDRLSRGAHPSPAVGGRCGRIAGLLPAAGEAWGPIAVSTHSLMPHDGRSHARTAPTKANRYTPEFSGALVDVPAGCLPDSVVRVDAGPAGKQPAMTVSPTMIAGRYQLLELLGQGGMGRVWLGRDTRLHRSVAIKEVFLPPGFTQADLHELRPRTLREARAAAQLNHPNVVRVFDILEADDAAWIVMEYVASRSLFQLVAESGPVTVAAAARYGLDVLSALTAAHQAGVMHRDVKPGNILIDADDRAVLTDFGLARMLGDPSVTRSGVVLGSPSFMAPERAAEGEAGPAADLWSLGATLYFAIAGKSPYERGSVLATLTALATEEPPALASAGPLWPVVSGLLRRDPTARLTAAAATPMLRQIAATAPAPPRQVSPRGQPTTGVPTAELDPAPAFEPSGLEPAGLESPGLEPPGLEPPGLEPPTAELDPAPVPVPPTRVARRWKRLAVIAVCAVLLPISLIAWAVSRSSTQADAGRTAPTPSSVIAPPGASSGSPSAGPSTTATSLATTDPLPTGWYRYADRTGFSIAVARSWTISRDGSIVYFSEPGGDRLLGIDQTDHPQADPVADWQGKEQYRVARGDFPGYQRVRLVAVPYFVKAADWEFTYLHDGVRLHVNNRGFITGPNQAYGMWWSTEDSQWTASLDELRLIQRNFRPAA